MSPVSSAPLDGPAADLAIPAAGEGPAGDSLGGESLYLTADGARRAADVLADEISARPDAGPLAADGNFPVPHDLLPQQQYLRVE